MASNERQMIKKRRFYAATAKILITAVLSIILGEFTKY
jgi:hypothetical protein